MITLEFLRHFRLFGFAIFDFAVSYLGILILSPLLTKLAKHFHLNLTVKHWLWLALPLGVLFHLVFNAATPLNKALLDLSGHYLEKIVILLMLYLGLKDIRKQP
jgi:hypothetical protein